VAQEDAGNQRATAADCTAASRSSVELACRGPTRRRRRPSRIPPAARPLLYTPDVREPDAAREAGTDFGRGVRHRKVDDTARWTMSNVRPSFHRASLTASRECSYVGSSS
jgi:hypothetical protein